MTGPKGRTMARFNDRVVQRIDLENCEGLVFWFQVEEWNNLKHYLRYDQNSNMWLQFLQHLKFLQKP